MPKTHTLNHMVISETNVIYILICLQTLESFTLGRKKAQKLQFICIKVISSIFFMIVIFFLYF